MAQMAMGQVPQRDELRDAQDEAKRNAYRSDFVDQMASATDNISGTNLSKNRFGDSMRKQGQQGVDDVLARDKRTFDAEDQGIQRDANSRAGAAEGRAAKGFSDSQEMDTPGTRKAKAYEALFRAKRPREARGITPEQAAGMSANDWKVALDTKDDPLDRPVGRGGAGGAVNGKSMAAMTKGFPNETPGIMADAKRIRAMIASTNGIENMPGIGTFEGKVPTAALGVASFFTGGDPDKARAFRQEIGNLAGTYLSSKGGKAITEAEDRIILGKIAANPGNATPDELERGLRIIERNTAAYARSSIAALPPEQRSAYLNSAGGEHDGELESWIDQPMDTPTGRPAGRNAVLRGQPSPMQPIGTYNPDKPAQWENLPLKVGKNGKKYRVFPDGSAELVQ